MLVAEPLPLPDPDPPRDSTPVEIHPRSIRFDEVGPDLVATRVLARAIARLLWESEGTSPSVADSVRPDRAGATDR